MSVFLTVGQVGSRVQVALWVMIFKHFFFMDQCTRVPQLSGYQSVTSPW